MKKLSHIVKLQTFGLCACLLVSSCHTGLAMEEINNYPSLKEISKNFSTFPDNYGAPEVISSMNTKITNKNFSLKTAKEISISYQKNEEKTKNMGFIKFLSNFVANGLALLGKSFLNHPKESVIATCGIVALGLGLTIVPSETRGEFFVNLIKALTQSERREVQNNNVIIVN